MSRAVRAAKSRSNSAQLSRFERDGYLLVEGVLEPERATPVPTHAGDVILMHKHTIHGSLPNVSDEIRWSLDLRYNPTGQPTGRPQFPGFVARSRRDPDSELRDPEAWARLWHGARTRLAAHPDPTPVHRWRGNEPGCA